MGKGKARNQVGWVELQPESEIENITANGGSQSVGTSEVEELFFSRGTVPNFTCDRSGIWKAGEQKKWHSTARRRATTAPGSGLL